MRFCVRGAFGAALLACGLLALEAVGVAFADKEAGGLRIEQPPSGSVTVEFGPSSAGASEGTFTLLLYNRSSIPLRPRLTLDPAEGQPSAEGAPVLYLHLVGSGNNRPYWLRSVDGVPTISPNGTSRLALVVGVPSGRDPDSIDGYLVVHAVTARLSVVGSAAVMPISASEADLSRVEPSPHALTVHAFGWLPGGRLPSGAEGAFELKGLGVPDLAAGGLFDGRGLLLSSDGRSVQARVELVRHGRFYQPMLRIDGDLPAGTYQGEVPISTGARSPALDVTLTARDSIIWTLVAVAVGAFFGGLLPLLGKRARKRDALRAALQGALIEYFGVEDRDTLMEWAGLSIAIGPDRVPWVSTEWLAQPGLHGAAGLFSQLHWAQSETELTAVEEAVTELMSRIEAWLRLQPKVKELENLVRTKIDDLDGKPWLVTGTSAESRQLWLETAKNEVQPGNATNRAQLLYEQATWHRGVVAAWQGLATTWASTEEARRTELRDQILVIASAPGPLAAADPPPAGNPQQLRASLEAVLGDLAIGQDGNRDSIEAAGKQWQSGQGQSGPAALVRAVVMRIGGLPSRAWLRLLRLALRSKPARIMAALRRQDLMLSIIAALGAMLVYALQIYTSTWGSLIDYLTAVAAGFGGQVIVRWGALPIFESWLGRRQ